MSRDGEPYTAWHWSWRDDETVWDDPTMRGHLLGLLVTADMAWPATADVPAGVPEEAVTLLVQRGYIEVKGHRYRVPTIDAWRAPRRAQAAAAAAARWRGDAASSARSSADSIARSTATEHNATQRNVAQGSDADSTAASSADSTGAPVLTKPFAELLPPPPGKARRTSRLTPLADVLPDVVPVEEPP